MTKQQPLAALSTIEQQIVETTDVRQLHAWEQIAEAAKRFAITHEQKVYAHQMKLRIARKGGEQLISMAERGERKAVGRPNSADAALLPDLDDLGLADTTDRAKKRSARWQALARMRAEEFQHLLDSVAASEPDADLGQNPHISQNSGESEWFTPPEYIESAKRVMGGIDLDPASTAIANEAIGATEFYDKDRDGLEQAWAGRVWMNPPYAHPWIWRFCERLCEEYVAENVTEACVLVNNATDTAWFQRMAEVAKALCFPNRRVRFWHPERESAAPLQGQAVLYFGENVKEFCTEFTRFGFTAVVL